MSHNVSCCGVCAGEFEREIYKSEYLAFTCIAFKDSKLPEICFRAYKIHCN